MQQPLMETQNSGSLGPRARAQSTDSPPIEEDDEDDFYERPDECRLVSKTGAVQVKNNIHHRSMVRAYVWQDIFTTLVDSHWSRILSIGAGMYLFLWFFFAAMYWVFNNESIPGCHKSDITSFVDAFLLSIDSQTTIGFGNFSVTSDCLPGIYVLVVQCLLSVVVDAAFVGLVFAKISRPQSRAATIVFSRFACIQEMEDGVRYLTIRVADQRKQRLVEAHARLIMYKTLYRERQEELSFSSGATRGERVEFEVKQLELDSKDIFLLLPSLIRHRIDESSPLYSSSLRELEEHRAEFVLLLEGSTASTSQMMQARQSYLPGEILLGHEFEPCCNIDDDGKFEIDFDRIHNTRPQGARTS